MSKLAKRIGSWSLLLLCFLAPLGLVAQVWAPLWLDLCFIVICAILIVSAFALNRPSKKD